ncbi:TetR/AcrR family transcriptional regulator [Serratia surfactantfaciens]|uniref:TetR/AcrR family transcriptional regulator n=1 Tax=Serratia surfactantfaciens TaxID=2741499 RepID=UPI0018E43794|nr:TetR/AcrR family transcriptional regulator [Serratia surfactantfaciens]MBI6153029.1 TetR/AcrR family transcriptional regulator [Serratia surfactantfaciens]
MANPNEEPLRARGRPATPETALRDALTQATLALLLDGGYAAATVDAVAKRAGVAKKTLYRFAANRDELVAQAVSGWTEAFKPAFAQDAGRREAVAPLLETGLKAVAQQVLSAEAVGMFRLLQSDFPGREALLDSYQRNGIQRGRATVADWLRRQQQYGWLLARDWAQTSDLLLAMTIAEPLRQMTLGLLPPGSAIDERIAAAVALVMPGLLRGENAECATL